MKNFDFEAIHSMSVEQKKQQLAKLSRTANKRLNSLEKAGLTKNAYAKAEKMLSYQNRNRFYTGTNYTSNYDIERALNQLETFLNSKSSTIQGYKRLKKERLQAFKENGIDIPQENADDFYAFLSSEQFKALGKRVDSNQVIEDYATYIKQFSKEEIKENFDDFLQGKIATFEQVGEILNKNKEGLLH